MTCEVLCPALAIGFPSTGSGTWVSGATAPLDTGSAGAALLASRLEWARIDNYLALKVNDMPMPYAQNLHAQKTSVRMRAPLPILKGIDLPAQPLTDGEKDLLMAASLRRLAIRSREGPHLSIGSQKERGMPRP